MTSALIAGAVLFRVLAAAGFALVYAPGAPGYSLTRDTLAIHDRFYPVTLRADAVDVGRIRIVDVADPQWQPIARTNGFSNRHYHSGWYRLAGGRLVRLYRADSRILVLLPPKGNGTAVLLEVPEPASFIADVRREWAGS